MDYKELIEQIKKDCKTFAEQNEKQANAELKPETREHLLGLADGYKTVLSLLKVYEECCVDDVDEKVDVLAKDSWENLCKFASAPHVVEGWNNYIYGFKCGYYKAKNE